MSGETTDSITIEHLELAFPDVECDREASGRWVAWLRGDLKRPVVAEGEDALDLRDALRRRRGELENRAHAAGSASGY